MPLTARALADALAARGLDEVERAHKQTLFERALACHSAFGTRPPAHIWWVPGRLEVFGKHTDYAGGRTLVCAVPRGFAVAASPRDDNEVRVADGVRSESVIIPAAGDAGVLRGWRNYVNAAVQRLRRNFPGARLGADIALASDLPSACGMSSSSALVIAIAAALSRTGALAYQNAWKQNIRNGLDLAGYYACIENGRGFAALGGDAGVGTHGGSEDHTAIVEGRPRHVSAFAFVPPRALGAAAIPEAWRLVIAPSGVAARKTGEARDPYNQLSARAALLLERWNRQHPRAASLGAALASGRDAADRLRQIIDREPEADTASLLRARLEHFVREDGRILDALEGFANGDAPGLGELSAASQRDAEELLGNQVPATSALAAAARARGALAACSFGAGFGGAVWALATTDTAESFAREWHPQAFVITPGPPLIELSAT